MFARSSPFTEGRISHTRQYHFIFIRDYLSELYCFRSHFLSVRALVQFNPNQRGVQANEKERAEEKKSSVHTPHTVKTVVHWQFA